MKRYFLPYLLAITIPVFLGLLVWQSNRYQNLNKELFRLEQWQEEWVESNKRLIAGIIINSTPERIEQTALVQLGLQKIHPENMLQVIITEGKGNGR
ncbi:MAG: cell division protein FtsL [Treponema sp.]|nr:cell division protein FtsL [Treponema sp.]MCL2272111.1 cell division protein FtsL [Treponema sp.]